MNNRLEEKAIKEVLQYATKYGYGNLIARLKRDWALMLMKNLGLKKEDALEAADVPAYAIKEEKKDE